MSQYFEFRNLPKACWGKNMQNTFGATVLGTAEFVEIVTAKHLAGKEVDRAVPAIRPFKVNPQPEEILKAVATVIGEKEKPARQVGSISVISTAVRN
jgi:REP-associated tyrosine transposase